jgi:hypothetical protein
VVAREVLLQLLKLVQVVVVLVVIARTTLRLVLFQLQNNLAVARLLKPH